MPASGITTTNGRPWPANQAVEYAPMAMNAAFPREICPVNPVRMLRPIAATTAIAVRFRTSSQYDEPKSGSTKRTTRNAARTCRSRAVSKIAMSAR